MNLRTLLFGQPLRSDAEAEEQIGPWQRVPVLGLDALASASYGPEAALTVLIAAGAAASQQIVPVSGALIGLLLLVYFSYRQTLGAYPNGGGSFTVAKENLGADAGLIAAAALRSTTSSTPRSPSRPALAPSSRRCPGCCRTRFRSASLCSWC